MGSNLSLIVPKIMDEVIKELDKECYISIVKDNVVNNKLVFDKEVNCKNLKFKNTKRSKSICNLKSIAKILARYVKFLNKDQKELINFYPTGNYNDDVIKINNYLMENCGQNINLSSEMSNRQINIVRDYQCGFINSMNTSNLTALCVINKINDIISEIELNNDKLQRGIEVHPTIQSSTPFATCFSFLFILIILAVIIVFIYWDSFKVLINYLIKLYNHIII